VAMIEKGFQFHNIVEFKMIGPDLWNLVKNSVMKLEAQFHPHLQQDEAEYSSTFTNPESISVGVFVETELLGYITGGPLEYYDSLKGVKDDPNFGLKNTVYIESVIVDEPYRNRGYGKELRRLFKNEATKKGYAYVTAHEIQGLPGRIGLIELPNWYDTGKMYMYYQQKLK